MHNIFIGEEKVKYKFESFRNWIINLDIWGSYLPLVPELYDIQISRTSAYVINLFSHNLDQIRANEETNQHNYPLKIRYSSSLGISNEKTFCIL